MWSNHSIRLKNKVSWRTSEEIEIDRDMWQKGKVVKKMCRMETSLLISLTLLSNNNNWPPLKFHNQLRVILTHTPALPIHNGWNYQELKRKRETHCHRWRIEVRVTRVTINVMSWKYELVRRRKPKIDIQGAPKVGSSKVRLLSIKKLEPEARGRWIQQQAVLRAACCVFGARCNIVRDVVFDALLSRPCAWLQQHKHSTGWSGDQLCQPTQRYR